MDRFHDAARNGQQMTMIHVFRDGHQAPAHQHPNGGGWVADTATVESTAYVGPGAEVRDRARVLERAALREYATISGAATARGLAILGGHSDVSGFAREGASRTTSTTRDNPSLSEPQMM